MIIPILETYAVWNVINFITCMSDENKNLHFTGNSAIVWKIKDIDHYNNL